MTIFMWGVIFLIAAIITGIMGFKKPRGNSTAKVFFYIFLILFVATVVYGLWQRYSYGMMDGRRDGRMMRQNQQYYGN